MVKLPIFNSKDTYNVQPTKIIGIGLNYNDHIAESESLKVKGLSREPPSEPILFPKTPNTLIGPNEQIIIPKFILEYKFENPRVDYEAELAVIIKDRCKNVSKSDALKHVYGYMASNDVSQRNLQNGDRSGFFRGKSLDTFCPVGPQVVLAKDIGDPQNLNLECRLNGKIVQKSNTSNMIFTIPVLIEFISKCFTLESGDIISTGTPSGVGSLHHGDIVEVILDKIGILRNSVVEESKQ
jgi:2-keto-4-pentenoate hydratase/2-oxohepta-3-ene-1,7-dioic acid hydratase in catechol pathway